MHKYYISILKRLSVEKMHVQMINSHFLNETARVLSSFINKHCGYIALNDNDDDNNNKKNHNGPP